MQTEKIRVVMTMIFLKLLITLMSGLMMKKVIWICTTKKCSFNIIYNKVDLYFLFALIFIQATDRLAVGHKLRFKK